MPAVPFTRGTSALVLLLVVLLPALVTSFVTLPGAYQPQQQRRYSSLRMMAAAPKVAVMVNGLPGAMGKEVAAACLRRGLAVCSVGLTGPQIEEESVEVDDGEGGQKQTVRLVKGPITGNGDEECDARLQEDFLELAKNLEIIAKEKGVKLILPTDVVIADKFSPDAESKLVPATEIPDGWMGLDNGPETTKMIQAELADCKTIIWNGPMGVFEFDKFAAGTSAIAETLAELTSKGATTIVGGGDSVAAVEKAGLGEKLSHVSTGGGASLEMLEGKALPGVAAIQDAK